MPALLREIAGNRFQDHGPKRNPNLAACVRIPIFALPQSCLAHPASATCISANTFGDGVTCDRDNEVRLTVMVVADDAGMGAELVRRRTMVLI